jgi:hypothetical protein
MRTFKINDDYSIEAIDDRNWVIKRRQVVDITKRKDKASTQDHASNTAIYGYYSTLESARHDIVELVAKNAGNFAELEKWVNKIKEVA